MIIWWYKMVKTDKNTVFNPQNLKTCKIKKTCFYENKHLI